MSSGISSIRSATEIPEEVRERLEANLDECVLCDLCLEAAPDGKVQVIKLYES